MSLIGKGFKGKCVFVRSDACAWPGGCNISGDFDDKLDLLSESMSAGAEFASDPTLQGRADVGCPDLLTENAGGSISIRPNYDRIGRLWTYGMGFENFDSPVDEGSGLSGHYIEPSDNLHCQCSGELTDCDTDGFDADQCFIRKGCLSFDKILRVETYEDAMVTAINLAVTSTDATMEVTFAPYRKVLHPGYDTSGWDAGAESSIVCNYLLFRDLEFILQPWDEDAATFDTAEGVRASEVTFSFDNALSTDVKSVKTGVYSEEPVRNSHRTASLTFTCPQFRDDVPGGKVDFEQAMLDHTRYMGRLRFTTTEGREFTLIFPNLRFRAYTNNLSGPEVISVSAEIDVLGGQESVTTWGIFAQYISDGAVWTNTGLSKGFYLYLVNSIGLNYLLG